MKDFLLIANVNAITYKEFFPLLKEGIVRPGYRPFNKDFYFDLNDNDKERIVKEKKEGSGWKIVDGEICGRLANACWYTTLHTPDKKKLVLTKKYHHKLYPHYDNYRAIEVSRVKDIPYDYECIMAVPITIFQYDLDNIMVKIDQQPERPLRKQIAIRGIWAGDREEADFIIKGTPTYVDENNKSFQGPVVNGKAKYARVVINLARRKKTLK